MSTQGINPYSPSALIMGTAISAGSSALAAGLFTYISPVGGAVFGASYYLSSHLINFICDKLDYDSDSPVGRTNAFALSLIGGIAAAAAMTTFIGFPITMAASVFLMTASVATTCVLRGCSACDSVLSKIADIIAASSARTSEASTSELLPEEVRV